jgi:hypothetical protein
METDIARRNGTITMSSQGDAGPCELHRGNDPEYQNYSRYTIQPSAEVLNVSCIDFYWIT